AMIKRDVEFLLEPFDPKLLHRQKEVPVHHAHSSAICMHTRADVMPVSSQALNCCQVMRVRYTRTKFIADLGGCADSDFGREKRLGQAKPLTLLAEAGAEQVTGGAQLAQDISHILQCFINSYTIYTVQ